MGAASVAKNHPVSKVRGIKEERRAHAQYVRCLKEGEHGVGAQPHDLLCPR